MSHELTDAEKFFFENNGYLVLEDFFTPSHVSILRSALAEVIEKRRECEEKGGTETGMTHIHGEKKHPYFLYPRRSSGVLGTS